MCIRDRRISHRELKLVPVFPGPFVELEAPIQADGAEGASVCLLYTSDAADERSSVDLGGRRIIKKKKDHSPPRPAEYQQTTDNEYTARPLSEHHIEQ